MLLIPWYAKHLMKSNKKISVGGFVHGLLIRGDAEFKNYTQTSHFGYHMRGGESLDTAKVGWKMILLYAKIILLIFGCTYGSSLIQQQLTTKQQHVLSKKVVMSVLFS